MSKPKSVFLSAVSGNILEYYDFTVYVAFVDVIGRTFFPSSSEFVQIISSLAGFAVGFVMRPVGGIVFGYIGDRYGRRISLIISMLGMTIPTFMIGLIPSYADIGILAPSLLIIMRLIQGLCISGEGAGAAIFILEHHQHLKPGLTAGIVHGSNIAGTLIASLIGIIIAKYFSNITFAWRFAFLLGGVLGIIGFYLRLRVSETPIFQKLANERKNLKAPLSQVVKTAWRSMVLTFCMGAVASSVLYLVKTHVNIFYSKVMHLSNTRALAYLSYASFIAMITMPLFGSLADRYGKFRMVTLSACAVFIFALPTLLIMASPVTLHQIMSLTMLGSLGGAISASAYIFIISIFKPEQKFSGVAFSYNLGIAICGGTSPVISSILIKKTGLFYSPAFYIMFTSFIFLLIIYYMRNTIRSLIQTYEYSKK